MRQLSFLFLSVFLLITGCATTPTTQIETFAESTAALTESTDNLIEEYNRSTVHAELRLMKAQHTPGKTNLTIEALSNIKNVFGDDAKKKLAIYRANKAIQNYAIALKALAQAGDRKEITKATVNLIGSLQGMETSYQTLIGNDKKKLFEKDELGTIGAVIDLIGSTIAEEKRRKALKEVIVAADTNIATLVKEVNTVIDTLDLADDIKTNNILTISNKIVDYNRMVENKEFNSNPEKQYELLLSLWEENQKAISIPKKIAHLQKSLEAISTQHSKIKDEVVKDRFTSEEIVKAVGTIQEMKKRYDEFENAIVTCDKVEVNDKGDPVCKDVTK